MAAYYNEIDPFSAQWLRELISAGHIAPGEVDQRSIEDVYPDELVGYTQCHFFAGIGVWSYALRKAGWPDDKPVWTGSCPCQPYSQAGKGEGEADERHLWPAWFHLIEQCRPGAIFGEQSASKAALSWLDLVQADLEGANYISGALDLCAAGVGAPNIRQRLYFVAEDRMGNASCTRLEKRISQRGVQPEKVVAFPWQATERASDINGLGHTNSQYAREHTGKSSRAEARNQRGTICNNTGASSAVSRPGPTDGFWRNPDWLSCRDGKFRPVEPGTFPLANGAPARVGRLRGYGNAINAELATVFISSYIQFRSAV
ncbi:DNA cytosine methyltransferase [Microbulbifer sp. 2304DJ12-6]|uniref:DNA cytosine methyltransferase n=1 Tax=Microbulbifer sp. 2304DJ12-6 TaxID=3233340 RepID=UPI0039B011EB